MGGQPGKPKQDDGDGVESRMITENGETFFLLGDKKLPSLQIELVTADGKLVRFARCSEPVWSSARVIPGFLG